MSDSRFRSPDDPAAERERWRNVRRERPASPAVPGPGQESVWDYPRPPRLEPVPRLVEVHVGDVRIAATTQAIRVCETASPPVVYLPFEDVDLAALRPSDQRSFCEWKGLAQYWHVEVGSERIENAAFGYPDPDESFLPLADAVAFYPGRVACTLGGERVRPQPGDYYAGWITDEIVGPFKGEPGTEGW